MIGVSNHLLSIVFRFHYHSQKVIGSIGIYIIWLDSMHICSRAVPFVIFFPSQRPGQGWGGCKGAIGPGISGTLNDGHDATGWKFFAFAYSFWKHAYFSMVFVWFLTLKREKKGQMGGRIKHAATRSTGGPSNV